MELLGTITLPGETKSAGEARDYAAKILSGQGTALDDALLIVSELISNALRHTASGRPEGTVTLNLLATPAIVRLEVVDAGGTSVPRSRKPDEDESSGRGLWIVEQLSTLWGVANLPPGGRTVYALMPRKARDA